MILSFLLGSGLSSLFGLEDVNPDREEISKKAKVEIMPYIYGDLINTGYGLSVRTQKSGHTFEFAPLFAPATRGMFGNSRNRMGLTCSYYYAFFQNHSFQPYIGCSVTCLRDLSKTVMWYYDGVNPNPRKISMSLIVPRTSSLSLLKTASTFPTTVTLTYILCSDWMFTYENWVSRARLSSLFTLSTLAITQCERCLLFMNVIFCISMETA